MPILDFLSQTVTPSKSLNISFAGGRMVNPDLTDLTSRVQALEIAFSDHLAKKNLPTPTPGAGGRSVTASSKTPSIGWMHTPQANDNFIVIIIGLTIPDTVPSGSSWTPVVKYGDQTIPSVKRTLISGKGGVGDNTRGHIEIFAAPIPQDWSGQERQVTLNYTTGRIDDYTLRGNSFTLPNIIAANTTFGASGSGTTANETRQIAVPSASGHLVIGCSACATKDPDMNVKDAALLWGDKSNDSRPFMVWSAPGTHPAVKVTTDHLGEPDTLFRVGYTAIDLICEE